MESFDATAELARVIGSSSLVVAGPGRSAWCATDHWEARALVIDCLGDVLPTAVGLSVGIGPRADAQVLSLEGDGSFLFGMQGLSTLAACHVHMSNFIAVILDNGILESGGGLPSRSGPIRWNDLCSAFDLPYAEASKLAEIEGAVKAVGRIGVLRLEVKDREPMLPPRYDLTGQENATRFRRLTSSLLGRDLPPPALKW